MNTVDQSFRVTPGSKGKTLFLVRHAKSSWDNVMLSDFDRPLNDRGKKDAPKMAKRLLDRKLTIDAFISSPAKRAKKTAELFIEQFNRDEKEIILIPALYHASVDDFYETINNTDNKFKSIAVFSHNPGITSFAKELAEEANIDDMPTCSIFAVNINIEYWSDFEGATKELLFFDYPKKTN